MYASLPLVMGKNRSMMKWFASAFPFLAFELCAITSLCCLLLGAFNVQMPSKSCLNRSESGVRDPTVLESIILTLRRTVAGQALLRFKNVRKSLTTSCVHAASIGKNNAILSLSDGTFFSAVWNGSISAWDVGRKERMSVSESIALTSAKSGMI